MRYNHSTRPWPGYKALGPTSIWMRACVSLFLVLSILWINISWYRKVLEAASLLEAILLSYYLKEKMKVKKTWGNTLPCGTPDFVENVFNSNTCNCNMVRPFSGVLIRYNFCIQCLNLTMSICNHNQLLKNMICIT